MTRPLEVREGDKFIAIRPNGSSDHRLTVECTIRFEQPIPIRQTFSYSASPETFIQEIARARTFGFLHEVQALWSRGLAKGGSLDNAVVISETGVVNPEGLRYRDEFVRHKVLDLIGDLSLLGRPLVGHVEAYCPGHQLNARLVGKILSSPNSWRLEEGGRLHDSQPAASTKPAIAPVTLSPELMRLSYE